MASSDLMSNLKPGWDVRDRRGRPANTAGVLQGALEEAVKGKEEEIDKTEDGDNIPDCTPGKKPMISDEAAQNFLDRGKAALPADGGEFANPGGSKPQQLEGDAREEEEYSRPVKRRRKEVERIPSVCGWCKRRFISKFALAAHSRFCRWKERGITTSRRERRLARSRNFDLNRLPPEARSRPRFSR